MMNVFLLDLPQSQRKVKIESMTKSFELFYSVWREIPGTSYCNTELGCVGSCPKCDEGYCCSGDTNAANGDCPTNAINAVSTTKYRCVKEYDVLSKRILSSFHIK